MADLETQIQKLSAAIAGLESQRKIWAMLWSIQRLRPCDEWQIGAQENATADLASAMKVARELSYL